MMAHCVHKADLPTLTRSYSCCTIRCPYCILINLIRSSLHYHTAVLGLVPCHQAQQQQQPTACHRALHSQARRLGYSSPSAAACTHFAISGSQPSATSRESLPRVGPASKIATLLALAAAIVARVVRISKTDFLHSSPQTLSPTPVCARGHRRAEGSRAIE